MATSGTVGYNQTRDQIINDAYIDLNVIAPGEILDPSDSQVAIAQLNKLIKAWEGQGLHLWANTRATLFLQKNQEKYRLNVGGDRATNSYFTTHIVGSFDVGETTFVVASTSGMNEGDNVGILMQDGYRFWTTIDNIINSTTFVTTDPITSPVDSLTKVYSYEIEIFRPLMVNNCQRAYNCTYAYDDYSYSEVPLIHLSRDEYFDLPNKRNPGPVNSEYYDPQLNAGYLYVWPMPDSGSDIVNFNYSRPLEDVENASDNVDFPQEWLLVITKYLSYLLAPSAEKDANQIAILKDQVKDLLDLALSFDDEDGSVYLSPNFRGMP